MEEKEDVFLYEKSSQDSSLVDFCSRLCLGLSVVLAFFLRFFKSFRFFEYSKNGILECRTVFFSIFQKFPKKKFFFGFFNFNFLL